MRSRDLLPTLGPAICRLRIYATSPGDHLWPLGEAYSPRGEESVAQATRQFKADLKLVLDALTAPVEAG